MDGSGSEGRGLWPRSMGFSRPHGFNTSGQEGSVPGYPPAAGCHQNAPVLGTSNGTQMPPYMRRYWSIRHSKSDYLLSYGGYCFWCVCTGMRLRHLLPSGKVEVVNKFTTCCAYEACLQRSEYKLELLLYFHPYVGYRDGAQAARLVQQIHLPTKPCLWSTFHFLFEKGSLTGLELHHIGQAISSMTFDSAIRELPGPLLFLPPQCWDCSCMPPCLAFVLQGKHFTSKAISSQH